MMDMEQYLGADLRSLGLFAGLIVGAAVIVTLTYWAIFGFDRWNTNVQTASDLMMAAVVSPVVSTSPNGQTPSYTTGMTGQFLCPTHGAVGLPNYDAAGSPRCPLCGQAMLFRNMSGNYALAAGAG